MRGFCRWLPLLVLILGETAAAEDTVTIAVQVGGKLRATLEFGRDAAAADLELAALADENVKKAIAGKEVRKVVVVPNRVVNVVV